MQDLQLPVPDLSQPGELDSLSVSAAYMNSLLGAAEQRGLCRATLLQDLSLQESGLADKERRIPAPLFLAVLNRIVAQGDEDIGLAMAEQARPGTFNALGMWQ